MKAWNLNHVIPFGATLSIQAMNSSEEELIGVIVREFPNDFCNEKENINGKS